MKIVEKMICSECERKKMRPALLIYKEVPDSGVVTWCDFCHEMRYCKCWKIRIGGQISE